MPQPVENRGRLVFNRGNPVEACLFLIDSIKPLLMSPTTANPIWQIPKLSTSLLLLIWGFVLAIGNSVNAQDTKAEDWEYHRDIEPLMIKYCGNCHRGNEKEGNFSIQTFDSLLAGDSQGKVIAAGKSAESKLIALLRGSTEPRMPPEDEAQPSAEEIERIAKWIDAGARASAAVPQPLVMRLNTPKIQPKPGIAPPYTSLVALRDNEHLIAGRFGEVVQMQIATGNIVRRWEGFAGKITSLRLQPNKNVVVVGGGVEGVGGEAALIDLDSGEKTWHTECHTDILYAAVLSADGRYLATAGYDREIQVRDLQSNQVIRKFTGHNGAVYDLDIDPSSQVIASASADETVKLWNIQTGERLDTLSQGEKEQYAVRFAPDGKSIYAGGADRKLRRWDLISIAQPAINPLRESRFAHESSLLQLRVGDKLEKIISLGSDGSLKQWTAGDLRLAGALAIKQSAPAGCEFLPDNQHVLVLGRDGKIARLATLPAPPHEESSMKLSSVDSEIGEIAVPEVFQEIEPNSLLASAQSLTLPFTVHGTMDPVHGAIDPTASGNESVMTEDADLYKFHAKQGETWIAEVKAAANKSPLDSRIDILHEDGTPVLRVNLQAVRESYYTFRGKDSISIDDFRLHKWQEMELNEYLYSDGEVVKLWLYPRGPDSGFKVYPGYGSRYTFFDTTPIAHALGAPAYIVRPLLPGQEPAPNGLPIFPIYYENDDDSRRELGSDSRLTFVAPADGNYVLRVRDSRGFGGSDYQYELTVRPARPRFEVVLEGGDLTIPVGRGREFGVTAKRFDGFEDAIEIELLGLPEGFIVTKPLTIEAGQNKATATIFAQANAALPAEPQPLELGLKANAVIGGSRQEIEVAGKLKLRLAAGDAKPEVAVFIEPLSGTAPQEAEFEIVASPGSTVSAKLRIERFENAGAISFGNDDSGRNLPHGVFIDNIGLNGLLLPEGQTEREFFITVAPWVEPQIRYFHLRSQSAGNPTSVPVRVRIEKTNQ
jgi:WD40 repeat protein